MSVQIGIILALFCALATNAAFLLKHRGAVAAPAVNIRHPLRSAAGLFRSRWFAIGMGVAVVGWILHVYALALAPLSLVQAVISGGLVLLAVLAERWFGLHLGRREWAGLALSAIGLAFLAITVQPPADGSSSDYSFSAMVAFEGGLIAFGAMLVLGGRARECHFQKGVFLGAASGVLFGVSDVALKALTGTVPGDFLSIISPWTATALIASVGAFYASARGLQIGAAIPVITMTSVAANVSAILGGILVFGDPFGGDVLSATLQGLAFATVIAAAALMPAPIRAAAAHS